MIYFLFHVFGIFLTKPIAALNEVKALVFCRLNVTSLDTLLHFLGIMANHSPDIILLSQVLILNLFSDLSGRSSATFSLSFHFLSHAVFKERRSLKPNKKAYISSAAYRHIFGLILFFNFSTPRPS